MIPDHHQGYIDWEQFTANGARLSANRTNAEVLPAPAWTVIFPEGGFRMLPLLCKTPE